MSAVQTKQLTPWREEMQDLAEVLQQRGKAAPAGSKLTLGRVPEGERGADGLPWFPVRLVQHDS